ncbi:MAG: hypothetical protein U0232_33970 [Thermomicrobiales bacterium]
MKKWIGYFFIGCVVLYLGAYGYAVAASFFWLVERMNFLLALGLLFALHYLRFPYPVPVLAYLGARTIWEWPVWGAVTLAAMGALIPLDQAIRVRHAFLARRQSTRA